jgi:uncharacterized phage-associated protein
MRLARPRTTKTMATVHDVAAFIVREHGATTAMKLQKLCFYAQAWSLAWGRGPLFEEPIEAWADGPVVEPLWREHRGERTVRQTKGDPTSVDARARETIGRVLEFYGQREPEWLSELTHREAPWVEAREGLETRARSARVISHERLTTFYGALARDMGDGALSEAYARGCELLLTLPPHEVTGIDESVETTGEDVARWLADGGEAPCQTSPTATRSS